MSTLAVAGILFDAADRVLLVQRGRPPGEGRWTVPGGKLEPGETIPIAVAREVREETGLEVEVGPLAEIVEVRLPGFHYLIHDHVVRLLGGTLAAASDARAARFVPWSEVPALPCTDGLIAVLARARATHAAWFGCKS